MLTAIVGRVSLNGVNIFTRRVGLGPEVVVLHGGPGAHHDYMLPQYDRLANSRRLVYYDQRGGGASPVPRDVPVGWQEQVGDLEALRQRWGAERLTILGYSWGGLLALLYAAEHPTAVERLALVAPASITRAHRDVFERRFAERMADPRLATARDALQASGLRERDPEAYRRRAFGLSVWGYFADPTRAAELTPFRVTERTRLEVWHSLGDYDLRAALAAVRVPALVIQGREDPIPESSAEEIASAIGAELLLLDGVGHAVHVEAPDALFGRLDAFLPTL
jgi:proline iminopeptidase